MRRSYSAVHNVFTGRLLLGVCTTAVIRLKVQRHPINLLLALIIGAHLVFIALIGVHAASGLVHIAGSISTR